jgi:type II secretory pathway component PulK
MMNRILTQIGTDASEIPGVIASIQDWIDPDDEVREGGAESAYYQGLPHPYNAKNAPLDDIAELLLIKGVTPDMFYGAAATNHSQAYLGANSPAANNSSLRPNAPIVASGLKDIFTTASSGKLNINFATRDELMMLPLVDASIADQILERTQNENLSTTGNFAWSSPTELLASTSLGNQGAGLVANYCTFRSSIFTITVDVHVGQSQRTYYAIVQRNSPRDIPIISFWWK